MRVTLWFACLLLWAATESGTAKPLPPGKEKGTYAFTTTGRVIWHRTPPGQIQLRLCDFSGTEIHRTTVGGDGTFELNTDLPPGSYYLEADVEPRFTELYWPARGSSINIAKNGNASAGHDEFYLMEKMEPLGPLQDSVVSDSQPVLRWKAMPQAREYQLHVETWDVPTRRWVVLEQPFLTPLTYYQFDKPLKPNSIVRWHLFAINRFGDRFAGWKGARFFTPGGAESLERDLALGQPITAEDQKLTTGKPWLGVSISSTEPLNDGFRPYYSENAGIYVHAVGNLSPAIRAGIQPGDVIMRYEGIRVRDVSDLLQLVAYSSIGSEVELEINRAGQTKTIKVEVGPRP